ncbi:MAG: ribosomal protein S18-alanine N-acetyltransferase [Defluviitaleaceae bacterium]|nr:ribosomal protein S18-alanine N-acetyltransferase [Defluviitaleaceae bacterium]
MLIKKGEACHVDQMYEIEKEAFSIPWTKTSIAYEISQDMCICFVAIQGERVIGHVYMRHIMDEGEIINIAVRQTERSKGVAGFLLKALLKAAKECNIKSITLEVRESNFPAISLYKKFGFTNQGIRKEYYSQPFEDGIIMGKYM